MKSSTGQKIGLPVDRGRHRSPNFVLLGLDLLTSIVLDLLRRHAKSWTASLKEEVGARRAVLKRQMLVEGLGLTWAITDGGEPNQVA